jgi:hypothetical protein
LLGSLVFQVLDFTNPRRGCSEAFRVKAPIPDAE